MSQPLSISTKHAHVVCGICTRTLLRGENVEVFVNGGRRYEVCELCKPHALHEGWMREGAIPDFQSGPDRSQRRRPLFGRKRRDTRESELSTPSAPRTLDDELSMGEWPAPLPPDPIPVAPAPAASRAAQPREHREPRHVHAIPTNGNHKVAAAVDVFNASQHRRTVSGVARSLGAPSVNLTPDGAHQSIVWIVVCWELCWYRYEVDLSQVGGSIRLDGQGYELSELAEHERVGNAASDESGTLFLA